MFDGADLRKTDDGSIYQKMAIIHQNVFLFNASLIDNITLWQEYQEQDLENALRISGVDQYNKISLRILATKGEHYMLVKMEKSFPAVSDSELQ